MDYPETSQEWDSYDGVIIPGSFSTAYETHIKWIRHLLMAIQNEIHQKQRKTLGVCFGHQCFAHSFGMVENDQVGDVERDASIESGKLQGSAVRRESGLASKCSVGPIAGRRSFKVTADGEFLLRRGSSKRVERDTQGETSPKEYLELLYTRGDMVRSLPPEGIALCGEGDLPYEACAYFASEENASEFQNQVKQQQMQSPTNLTALGQTAAPADHALDNDSIVLPYAITFQAHPEYMTPRGLKTNYVNTVNAMKGCGFISHETCQEACEDASLHHDCLSSDSLDAVVSAGVILGWFKR
jgi:hypothetical protein